MPLPSPQLDRRSLVSSLTIAIVLGAVGVVAAVAQDFPHYGRSDWWPYADVVIGVGALTALIYRRDWPIPTLLATAALATVSGAAAGPAYVVAASICARHRWRELALAGGVTAASGVIYSAIHVPPEDKATTYAWVLAASAVVVTVGWLIGQWRHDPREAWSNTWRMSLALVVGFLLWIAVAAEGEARGFAEGDLWMAIDPLIGVVAVALIPLRRSWPIAIVTITAVLSIASTVSGGAAILALISLSTSRRWDRVAIGAVVSIVTGMLFNPAHGMDLTMTDAISNVVFIGFAVALGLFIGARRELVNNLRAQVEAAESEKEARVATARTQERTRIAREMHDVLAHRISLVAMHAGALAYREDLPPEQVRKTATLLSETSHHALTELREILGVLRDDGTSDGQPEPPQPTLCDLDDLIASCRTGGQTVEMTSSIATAEVPEKLSRNAFRIVQEALTNARKHAPGEPVQLTLDGHRGGDLTLEVRNAQSATSGPAAPGAGLGLVGLRERASLSGGKLKAGPDRANDWVVRATLPWNLEEESDR